ncbi:MAG TPA: replication-associated recombination protein A [Terracidiphilus sp.]|jgi:putative ATPase|nr:replication-associated recombination protein A [Terracidiphilus sp.]
MSLFDGEPEGPALSPMRSSKSLLRAMPLAERMRPRTLDEYSGQEHLLGPGKPLRIQIERDANGTGELGSMILWGPPGVGKTTLAKIIAETTQANFVEFSAVMSGIKEIKQVMASAAQAAEMHSRTILFVDEIHRFNKAQQDAFLPYVERGTIRLIGATTENPSFEIISALLSRCRVYVLQPLSEERIAELLRRAIEDRERGLGGMDLQADDDALLLIASYSSGDCRSAYNTLEVAAQLADSDLTKRISKTIATEAVQQRVLVYDKSGEEHYNLISALHKSVRNSDPDAALYWLARMFAGGEDSLYLARRIVRMAIEDIGLAAPEALNLCLSAKEAVDFLGSPEGDLALAEAVVYLSLAPKSNAVYTAYGAVQQEIEHTRQEPVPLHLRNAPTRLMKEIGYSKGYRYAHDEDDKVADMDCLPDSLRGRSYYRPTQEGREKLLAQRMEEIRRIRSGKHTGK